MKKALFILATPLLLAACGGSDSDSSPELNQFDVDFQAFNYVSTGVSLEASYNVEPFTQSVTLFDGSVYGIVTQRSLLIQYEGDEADSYRVELELSDANSTAVLASQTLNVNSQSDDHLVYAVGEYGNTTTNPPRLVIEGEPDDDVADGKAALYILNVRDTSIAASSYSIEIDGTQVHSGVEQATLSPLIEVNEGSDVTITVNDSVGVKSCDVTNFDWSSEDAWVVVFEGDNCYEPIALD